MIGFASGWPMIEREEEAFVRTGQSRGARRFDDCSNELDCYGVAGNYRRDRGNRWRRFRRGYRALHLRQGARKRSLALVAVVGSVALTVGVAFPASAVSPLDPPPVVTALDGYDLPSCDTDVSVIDAVGLGWRGTRTGVFNGKGSTAGLSVVAAPTSLCITSGGVIAFMWGIDVLAGFMPSRGISISDGSFVLNCASASNGSGESVITSALSAPSTPSSDSGGVMFRGAAFVTSTDVSSCPYVKSASITLADSDSVVRISSVWKPKFWDSASSGWSVDEGELDPYYEAPIVCSLAPEGDDLLAWIGDLVSKIVSWVPCMTVPAGWDRSEKLADAWNGSSVVAFGTSLSDNIPSSFGCGVVATVPIYGEAVSLDTCPLDVVPSAVKLGVTAMLGAACVFAMWRRILWSVGSGGGG